MLQWCGYGRAFLDGLKAILRKHSDQRDLVPDNERHRRVQLQRPIADGHCHERYVTVRRCANRGLRQVPVGVIELRLMVAVVKTVFRKEATSQDLVEQGAPEFIAKLMILEARFWRWVLGLFKR